MWALKIAAVFRGAGGLFLWCQYYRLTVFLLVYALVPVPVFVFVKSSELALVRHTVLRRNFECRAPQDLQVKPERAPPQILRVKASLF